MTAALHPMKPKNPAKLVDCGARGLLTVREIAEASGCSPRLIYERVQAGITGDKLFAQNLSRRPRQPGVSYRSQLPTGSGDNAGVGFAIRLVLRYRNNPPSVEVLCRDYGMHRSTAYRWRREWLAALGRFS